MVLNDREWELVQENGADGLLGLVFFSAKESIHKALFPASRVWMDFLDVELRLGDESGVMIAAAVGEVAPRLEDLVIRGCQTQGFVMTGAFLPPR